MYRRVERGGGERHRKGDWRRGEKEKKERIKREREEMKVYIVNEKFKRGKKSCTVQDDLLARVIFGELACGKLIGKFYIGNCVQ